MVGREIVETFTTKSLKNKIEKQQTTNGHLRNHKNLTTNH